MFPKGPRFLPHKIPDVPGPNSYNIIQESQLESYKRGAFLEKADRFSEVKPSDIPGPGTYNTDMNNNNTKPSTKKSGPASNPTDRYALLQTKAEELKRLHADSKKSYQAEVDRLKLELARCQKTNGEQAERLDKQKKQAEVLDVRIQEFKKSSSTDHAEIKDLRLKLRMSEHERAQLLGKQGQAGEFKQALQVLESKRRDEIMDRDKKIADLEKYLLSEKRRREAAETRVEEIKKENEEGSRESRTATQQLEVQINEARDEARHAQSSLQALASESASTEQELVTQLEQYRSTLSRVAEEYGRLASATVPASAHSHIKYEHSALLIQVFRLERKLANVEGQVVELANLVRHTEEENAFLSTRLRDIEEEALCYLNGLNDLPSARVDQLHLGSEQDTRALADVEADIRGWGKQKLEAHILGSEAACQFYHYVNGELFQLFWAVDKSLEEKDALVQQHIADRDAASATYVSITAQLKAVQAERDNIKAQLDGLVLSMEELKATSQNLGRRLEEAETKRLAETSKNEEVLKKERCAIQRLTSTVQKSRMAEEGLRADIEQLIAELKDAERYQEAYYRLSDEVNALVARNELAEGEAERLSKFNAEILGHTNPAQRIMYVDRIRKQLAELQKQLLKCTLEHEMAVAEGNALRHELDMYKSVVVENKPRTNITRVGRPALVNQSLNVSVTVEKHLGDEKAYQGQLLDTIPGDMTLDEIM